MDEERGEGELDPLGHKNSVMPHDQFQSVGFSGYVVATENVNAFRKRLGVF